MLIFRFCTHFRFACGLRRRRVNSNPLSSYWRPGPVLGRVGMQTRWECRHRAPEGAVGSPGAEMAEPLHSGQRFFTRPNTSVWRPRHACRMGIPPNVAEAFAFCPLWRWFAPLLICFPLGGGFFFTVFLLVSPLLIFSPNGQRTAKRNDFSLTLQIWPSPIRLFPTSEELEA